MRMKFDLTIACLSLVAMVAFGAWIALAQPVWADAKDGETSRVVFERPKYPNESEGGSALGETRYELFWAKAGIYTFYKLHGYWPASWQSVVDDGLFDNEIRSSEGHIVNPDDSKLDFFGDVVYMGPSESRDSVALSYARDVGGLVAKQYILEAPATYEEQFAWILQNRALQSSTPEVEDYVSKLIDDEQAQKQVAIAAMFDRGILLFNVLNGRPPYTWDEYIQSGLAPFRSDSVNALTGTSFAGDGRAGDFLYRYYAPETTESGNPAVYFTHIDPDGSLPLVRITY